VWAETGPAPARAFFSISNVQTPEPLVTPVTPALPQQTED
jgi:hypothetical protein